MHLQSIDPQPPVFGPLAPVSAWQHQYSFAFAPSELELADIVSSEAAPLLLCLFRSGNLDQMQRHPDPVQT